MRDAYVIFVKWFGLELKLYIGVSWLAVYFINFLHLILIIG